MTVCTSYCVAVALGATLNYVLPALILIQLAFLHGILESSGQRNRSLLHARAVLILTTLGELGECTLHDARSRLSNNVCAVFRLGPNGLSGFKDIMCVLEGLASLSKGSSRFDRQ